MKRQRKKNVQFSIACLLVLTIIFTLIPNWIVTNAATAKTVYFGATAVTLDYAPGSYFTDNGAACKDHSKSGIHSYTRESACNCKCTYKGIVLGAVQCFGYARYIEQKLFGKNSYTNPASFYHVTGAYVAKGSLTASKLKSIMTSGKVKPGAHLRTNSSGHSMIITQITNTGFSIIQANGSNNDEYSGHYACRIGTHTYTWSSYVSSTYGPRGISYIEMPYNYSLNYVKHLDMGEDFYATIVNTNSKKLVAANGKEVVQEKETAYRNQLWYFVRQSDGSYQITNIEKTSSALNVVNSGSSGTNVSLANKSTSKAQCWYIMGASTKNCQLVPVCTADCALTIQEASTNDGANVQIQTMSSSAAQQFSVLPITNNPAKPTLSTDSKIYSVGDEITFNWGESAYATEYSLDYFLDEEADGVNLNATNYTFKPTIAGEYYFYLTAVNNNDSVSSDEYIITVTDSCKDGHSWDIGKITKAVTCTEDGKKLYTCTVCGATKTKNISATGHQYVKGVCNVCGDDIRVDLNDCVINYSSQVSYTGKEQMPEVTVAYKDNQLEENKDYQLAYENNTDIGTATLTVIGNSDIYIGSIVKQFTITKGKQTITASSLGTKTYSENKVYKLNAKSDGDGTLTYTSSDSSIATVDKKGNVILVGGGKADITIKASKTDKYNSASKKISLTVQKASQTVTVEKTSYHKVYGDKAFTLKATTNRDGKISYASNNKAVATVNSTSGKVTLKGYGKAIITVTAKETSRYSEGVKKITVIVNPAKMSTPSVKSLLAGTIKVSWKKDNLSTGYQIRYSTKSSLAGGRILQFTGKTLVTKTISKLTKGKKYYVQVRPYKMQGSEKYVGAWSDVVNVTTKK